MSSLTEKMAGLCQIDLEQEDQKIVSKVQPVDVLTFDEWPGIDFLPELLAAYVTPNHPVIQQICRDVAVQMNLWTGNPSLDGYSSKSPTRVKQQFSAVYSVLQSYQLVYSVPPASFERAGQRVRLSDTVISQKKATCLDLTLLYASCLEGLGLNPILVIMDGHAFIGVWLEEMSFPEIIQDDVSMLSKRIAKGIETIAVAECTTLTAGSSSDFTMAGEIARLALADHKRFQLLVDVMRARAGNIRPLPQRVLTDKGWVVREMPDKSEQRPAMPEEVHQYGSSENKPADSPSRKLQWERRLLDLSLRNTLLNMRITRNVVPILCDNLSELADAISQNVDFQLSARPDDWKEILQNASPFELNTVKKSNKNLLRQDFKNRRLRTSLSEPDLSKASLSLYRAAKLAQEENGANTLFLVLGLLKWFEGPSSQRERYAPLVLLPVDIIRKSIQKGYIIRLRDEEPLMNITLLEMLRHDFGLEISGLDPLPAEDNMVNLRSVLSDIRHAIMLQTRWDVIESSFLGIFSFTQFVMWNDIRNRSDDLTRNKIVSSLMAGKLTWIPPPMPDAQTVETDAILPVSADASQLRAVKAAGEQMSFVLHGPPGTGKSQTITNIIAKTISQGKTILFAAEKMAALSVVQRRLQQIGIKPFCLELHSSKSSKRYVLDQLSKAIEVSRHSTAREFEIKAASLAAARGDLEKYSIALHRQQNCGMSLFELINAYEDRRAAPDAVRFSGNDVMSLQPQQIEQWQKLTRTLIAAAKAAGHPHRHPLAGIGQTQYSQQLKAKSLSAVNDCILTVDPVVQHSAVVTEKFGVRMPVSLKDYTYLVEASEAIIAMKVVPASWLGSDNLSGLLVQLPELIKPGEAMSELYKELSSVWKKEFLALDGVALSQAWNFASEKWVLLKFLRQRAILKQLSPYAISRIKRRFLGQEIASLSRYQSAKAGVAAILPVCFGLLDDLYKGEETDWIHLKFLTETAGKGESVLNSRYSNGRVIRQRRADIAFDHSAETALIKAWNVFQNRLGEVSAILQADYSKIDMTAGYLRGIVMAGQNWISRIGDLREWVQWQAVCSEANLAGLQSVVSAYEDVLDHEDVFAAFERGLYFALASHAIDTDQMLNNFSGAVFEEKIAQFRRLDSEIELLSKQEIIARLAARVPDFTLEAAQSSELGILQRAIRGGGRGISIRRLFESIPNLLPRLCPCMLMSPISVAQYMDPKHATFDLIVFDEASQLPTCKAVGVLARGKDAVIVGDPKQLPPTRFFEASNDDDEQLEAEDLESVLDDCLALSMPETHLLWHYRSSHESLIAFSNMTYYDNKLLTFPSPNDQISKVRFVPVNGIYDRSRTRQNRIEAKAVVDEIVRRLENPETREQSIGVVTFSSAQQIAVDDLLNDVLRLRPELEEAANQGPEPLFIKNLENVQGDERDVILFSVGYGPDEQGRMTLNFGPLNREGGWRRLNVAVSRARMEMLVFSTLSPDQIDISRTNALGVSGLKEFLGYARLGIQISRIPDSGNMFIKAGVSRQIGEELAKAGYANELNIGRSGFRIDVGIIDPDNPSEYLLGVLLDGKHCRQPQTARDSAVGQINILQGLNWQIHRIWTMDWWENREKVVKSLLEKVEHARQNRKSDKAPQILRENRDLDNPGKPLVPDKPAAGLIQSRQSAGRKNTAYTEARIGRLNISLEDLLLDNSNLQLLTQMYKVIEMEAPISEGLLMRRILNNCGIARAGSRIKAKFTHLFKQLNTTVTMQNGIMIYWRKDQTPDQYEGYRRGGRDAMDIPVEEVASAVHEVLLAQFGLPREALLKETAKLFDISRLGPNVIIAMEMGLHKAVQQKKVKIDAADYITLYSDKMFVVI